MKDLFNRTKTFNRSLPLDKQIHNEVLLILSLMAIITGIENFLVNLPTWYGLMFIAAGVLAISMLFLNHYKSSYWFSKLLTVGVMYAMTIVSWLFNGGLDGPALLFIGAIAVFSVAFYGKRFLLLFMLNFLVLASLILINYYFPESLFNTYHNESERAADMILSYLLIIISIILVINTILKNYNRASKTVNDQKQEMEMLNNDLKTANKELVNLNASKDKLFSIIAHDLRSPLGSLVSFTDILATNLSGYDTRKIEESVILMNKTQKKTLDLLEDLLLWSKSQSGQLAMMVEKTDFRGLCHEIMDEKRDQAILKNIKMENFLRDELFLYADRNMLKIILRNMVSNAIKFTGRGGEIAVHSETEGMFEKIMVKDTGIGMTEKERLMLWDIRNQQINPGTEGESGSGLGLMLCKDFVERHGGKIWAESEQGKGSRLFFTIPWYKESAG